MTINAYTGEDSAQTNEYPELEEQYGEDPARFLETNELLATARIRGIRDPALLNAYREVAEEITTGQYRTTILEALADRERELTGDAPDPNPSPTPETPTDAATATDGGTDTEPDSEPEPAPEPDTREIHTETTGVLEAGEVLVVDRDGPTEYIWPATAEADEPYVLRTFDAEGDERVEPMGLDEKGIRRRIDLETERTTTDEIEKDAPATAATGGDA